MKWILVYAPKTKKQLHKIPNRTRLRIIDALDAIESNPLSGVNIKPLENVSGCYRCRVGEYRIIFTVDLVQHAVFILNIGKRSDTTYRRL